MTNVDQSEIEKFGRLAHRWWDPGSDFKPLHDINPLRLGWIDGHCRLAGKSALDVGCGGGLLAEGMNAKGATVTGIDLSDKALSVARLHLLESGRTVDYRQVAAEELAAEQGCRYDVVTCMEMLEHVPDPASTVAACAALVKPGGHVFFSTINRSAKAYLFAVIGAEYVLRMLPIGTHDYARFIRPSELLRWARAADLAAGDLRGMTYNPLTGHYALGKDSDVNYLLHAVKNA
jgi:2-polyprenyl-6-hydroxyphenyl methylase/3-demethylubiquinone-9 3-methyltransferase